MRIRRLGWKIKGGFTHTEQNVDMRERVSGWVLVVWQLPTARQLYKSNKPRSFLSLLARFLLRSYARYHLATDLTLYVCILLLFNEVPLSPTQCIKQFHPTNLKAHVIHFIKYLSHWNLKRNIKSHMNSSVGK